MRDSKKNKILSLLAYLSLLKHNIKMKFALQLNYLLMLFIFLIGRSLHRRGILLFSKGKSISFINMSSKLPRRYLNAIYIFKKVATRD